MSRSNAPRNPIEGVVRYAVAIGATLVLVLPAARGGSAVGWLPLWLVGMPLCAWACLRLVGRLEGAGLGETTVADRSHVAAVRRLPVAPGGNRRRRVPARRRPRAPHDFGHGSRGAGLC